MPGKTFELADGEEIEIESGQVVQLSAGEDEGKTAIELQDGEEVIVVATKPEVIAELGLKPLDYFDGDEDDELVDDLVEDEDDDLGI